MVDEPWLCYLLMVREEDEVITPVLVLPVYRGGPRFLRALASVEAAAPFFRRIIVSSNGPVGNPDYAAAQTFCERVPSAEVLLTGAELPWMDHQYFWLSHLEQTGLTADDWIMWFAHDDELKPSGIAAIVDERGSWPLQQGTCYLGPWAMRHEQGDVLFDGPRDVPLESWTSFPMQGPLRLPVAEWIAQQLEQPTYINMSGCVTTLRAFQALRAFPIRKPGGMRIEMATAAAPHHRYVAEFQEPVVITYGRPNSDRTQYARVARRDDRHMVMWLLAYLTRHPEGAIPTARAAAKVLRDYARVLTRRGSLPEEDWRYRETVGA